PARPYPAPRRSAVLRRPRLLRELPHELDEILRIERLGHVRVDPEGEPALFVGLLRPRGEQDHLDVPRPLVVPQPGGRDPPVEPRHHHIEGDHIRPDLQHPVQTVLSVTGGLHLEPLQGEVDRDQLPDDLVVIHHQHTPRRITHGREARPNPLPSPTLRPNRVRSLICHPADVPTTPRLLILLNPHAPP